MRRIWRPFHSSNFRAGLLKLRCLRAAQPEPARAADRGWRQRTPAGWRAKSRASTRLPVVAGPVAWKHASRAECPKARSCMSCAGISREQEPSGEGKNLDGSALRGWRRNQTDSLQRRRSGTRSTSTLPPRKGTTKDTNDTKWISRISFVLFEPFVVPFFTWKRRTTEPRITRKKRSSADPFISVKQTFKFLSCCANSRRDESHNSRRKKD